MMVACSGIFYDICYSKIPHRLTVKKKSTVISTRKSKFFSLVSRWAGPLERMSLPITRILGVLTFLDLIH